MLYKRITLAASNTITQEKIYKQQNNISCEMEAETGNYSIMLDTSGSTGGSKHYWESVQEVLNLYSSKIDRFYFWNTSIEKIDKKRFQQAIDQKKGWGGTSPSLVANEVIKENLKSIILITDGQVSDSDVQSCDKILKDYQFVKSICYIISSDSYGFLNMSVTCPFTRKCENQVYEKKQNEPFHKLVQYTPEDYKILDTLDDITLDNFTANYDKIEGLIISLNMGKESNIPLKNQLVMMKNRLVKELSKQKGTKDITEEMRGHLENKNFDGAMKIAEQITKAYFSNSMTTDLEKQISHLINLCGDLRGKYDINQIKSNKMAIAKDAKEGVLEQVEVNDLSKNPIQCPIIMDEDVPQILVDECEPVFVGVQKNIVDDISACPLRILNYPEVKAKLKARLSNYMGVKYADKFMKNPFTQNKLLGAIPLGSHKSHVEVGNCTIAKMISGGKILGNLNMFYAAIWYIIKEKEIQYLQDIQKNATEHLVYRLKNSRTFASMCGLAQFVTTQLPSDVAVWYCVNSCVLNQPSDRDTFRFHVYNINPMIDILKELNYPIHEGVLPHLARTKSILGTLAGFKRLSTKEKLNFKEAIRCLYQNCVEIKKQNIDKKVLQIESFVHFIPVDGPANEEKQKEIISKLPQSMHALSVEEIVYIGGLMDAQKSAADLPIDFNFKIPALPASKIEWKYELQHFQRKIQKINPKTFRLQSRYGKRDWEEVVEEYFKIPAKDLFKGRKYFQDFLNKYHKMPNADELVLFYYNRYVIGGKKSTLPAFVNEWAEDFVKEYTLCMEEHKLSVEDAIKILEQSRPREQRLKIEDN